MEIFREYKSIYNLTKYRRLIVTNALGHHTRASSTTSTRCSGTRSSATFTTGIVWRGSLNETGEDHLTRVCIKPLTTPPKCANCSGEHLSSYIRCLSNANNPKYAKTVDALLPKEKVWLKRKEENDKKRKEEKEKKTTTPETNNDGLAMVLGSIILILNATNATLQQKIDFIKQTEELSAIFNDKH